MNRKGAAAMRLKMSRNAKTQIPVKEFWVHASPELQYAHPEKCGELAKIRWQGPPD